MREQVRHQAPAKLTLTLRVMGRRNDGYHLIDAEMTTLELADELTFSAGENELAPEDLVSRALVAVGRPEGVHVLVDKQIPVGAGLGGGSADAAAVLRWAGCSDLEVAVGLGADVPFCLVGGRARVSGIGEVVEPLAVVEQTFTLLTPPFPVWTPLVYRAWDAMGGPSSDGPNDLEPAALRVEPRLAEWRDRLGDATGHTPQLAGSGGTWFVEGDYPEVEGGVVTRTGRP
ncbi:MAG TPA: 4-(cytidine 5'-diphospho)-2-C-methyl-D-erythritol kinase [Acidimicrobiales bacterium]|nr:4-(cytidine 5'-diphospho)-2-C-methyl-D-erythritol kinase [Acidimicrobiales bacterium]